MDPIVPSTAIIITIAPTTNLPVPAIIAQAGATVAERFLEFFAANIRNPNTRIAYARAVRDFFRWTEQYGLTLSAIRPLHGCMSAGAKLGHSAPREWRSAAE